MFCEGCGKEINVEAAFCSGCGTSTQAEAPLRPTVFTGTPSPTPLSISVADHARVASRDTMQTLKVFVADPTGSLLPVYESLEPKRAIGVGVGLAILFDICLLFTVWRALSSAGTLPFVGYYFSYGIQVPWFKFFVLGLVPYICITLALMAAHKAFRGSGAVHGDFLVAGLSLLPLALATAASSVIGFANIEVISLLFLFALTYTIIILFMGCVRVAQMRESAAAFAVPLILLFGGWLLKIAFMSLLTSFLR
jgi:hypothetical protein